jgi:hypothetical protein
MQTSRKGLLVVLVLLSVAVAAIMWDHDAGARTFSASTIALQSPRGANPGSTTESGEPDVGQTGKQSSQQSSVQPVVRNLRVDGRRGNVWGRWTSWIWMARLLGARF